MIKDKINKLIRNEKFPFVCLVVGLFAIFSMIIFGTIISIVRGEPWEKVEGCVENSFLTICLLLVVIYYKKDKHIVESLMGELLAIAVVTNTTYFVETLIEDINGPTNTFEYVYLVIEFLIMLTSVLVFFDHLHKSNDEKVENSGRLVINIMLILIACVMTFDLIILIVNHDSFDTLMLIDEIIYMIFSTSLTFAVLSRELIRVEQIKVTKGD